MKRKCLPAACIIALHLLITAKSQDMPNFVEKLTTEQGLSSNKINDIAQDDNGFLWIATPDGLNRFDGTEVLQYFHSDNTSSIPHNYVYCLKPLTGNVLALGTEAGLSFYDGNTGMFSNFLYKKNDPLDKYNNTIIRLETDANGNLWAASLNCIFVFDHERKLKKIFPSYFTEKDAAKQRLKYVEKILPLSTGEVLLYLYQNWYIYSARTDKLTELKNYSDVYRFRFLENLSRLPDEKKFIHYFPASHIFPVFGKYFLCVPPLADSLELYDDYGHLLSRCFFPFNDYPYVLWSQQVATSDSSCLVFLFHNYGLVKINTFWKNNQPLLGSISPLMSDDYEYTKSMQDREGNWWLATSSEGLQKFSPSKQYFSSRILTDGPGGKKVRYEVVSFSRYKDILWTSTYGQGFFKTDLLSGKQKQFLPALTEKETWANFIWNVRQVNDDTLWIGTQTGLYWYSLSSKKKGRLSAYAGKPGILDSVAITTQFEDSHGLIWMGLGKGNGVCYFDPANKRFVYYPGNNVEAYPLRYPLNIAEDKKGDLWFTNDASSVLVKWDRGKDHFQIIALPSSPILQPGNFNGLFCDDNSILWLGSVTNGLVKFNPYTNSLSVYSHDRGLDNCTISSLYADRQKRIWAIADGGLSCFDQNSETFMNYTAKDGLPVQYPADNFFYDSSDHQLYAGGKGAFFWFNPDKVLLNRPAGKIFITSVQVNGKPYGIDPLKPAIFGPQQNDITIRYTAVNLTGGAGVQYQYQLTGEDSRWIMAGTQRQINFSRLAPGKYTFMVKAINNTGMQAAQITFYITPPFTQTGLFYALIIVITAALFYSLYRFRLRQLLRAELMRKEISENLHDEVGGHLTNISLSSLLAQKQVQDPDPLGRILDRIYQDSQTVSEAMREIVWSINPEIDTMGQAMPRMLHYASGLLETKNIELTAEISPEVERIKLSMTERRDLYMIFKESVNNMAKHSGAVFATISMQVTGKILIMKITDNGQGFNKNNPLLNNGLKNMKERARRHKWHLDILTEENAGTSILLQAPIA